MRPHPSEVVAGIRSTLREVIAPELSSDHARTRLDEIRSVLAQIDWDEAGFLLAGRNARLAAALGAFAAWAAGDGARAAHFHEASAAVTAALEAPAEQTYRAHAEWSTRLDTAAEALVEPLSEWLAHHRDDDSAARARDALLAAL